MPSSGGTFSFSLKETKHPCACVSGSRKTSLRSFTQTKKYYEDTERRRPRMMCLEEDEMFGCCFLGEGGGGALPSSLEARNWANSLDKLLLSSYGTALFRAFLQKEYAEENLDFVLKVERYRQAERMLL
jgi:hypothetical protein